MANHLRDAGGVDYVQSVFRAYKAHLRSVGLHGLSRESFSKYVWLANRMGLIVFDHAEPSAYWDGQVDGVTLPRAYVREPRPQAPSPRHYYRIVDPTDPRWLRIEASYRASIGIEVPPPAPRKPREVAPPVAAPPRPPKPPKPVKVPKIPKVKVVKVKKPTPAEAAAAATAPFEVRIGKVVEALVQIERTPNLKLAKAVEDELLAIYGEVSKAAKGKRGAVGERLVGLQTMMRRALDQYGQVEFSLRNMLRETLPSRKASFEVSLQAALGIMRETLTGEEARVKPVEVPVPAPPAPVEVVPAVVEYTRREIEEQEGIINQIKTVLDESKRAPTLKKLKSLMEKLNEDMVEGIEDIETAIEEYEGVERKGLTPEEYRDEREGAFTAIQEAIDELALTQEVEEPSGEEA